MRLKATGGKSTKLILNKEGAVINPEVKNVQQLIFSKELHDSEEDYIFYFTINLLEACCARNEVPMIVIRIAWNSLKFMIDEGTIKITDKHREFAQTKIEKIRAEIVFEFVKLLGIQSIISPDYFEKLAHQHIENGRFPEATTLIIKFNIFNKFDLLDLIVNLVQMNRVPTAKLILDHVPALRERAIRKLSTPHMAKAAAGLVKDYKLNPEDFPEL